MHARTCAPSTKRGTRSAAGPVEDEEACRTLVDAVVVDMLVLSCHALSAILTGPAVALPTVRVALRTVVDGGEVEESRAALFDALAWACRYSVFVAACATVDEFVRTLLAVWVATGALGLCIRKVKVRTAEVASEVWL